MKKHKTKLIKDYGWYGLNFFGSSIPVIRNYTNPISSFVFATTKLIDRHTNWLEKHKDELNTVRGIFYAGMILSSAVNTLGGDYLNAATDITTAYFMTKDMKESLGCKKVIDIPKGIIDSGKNVWKKYTKK